MTNSTLQYQNLSERFSARFETAILRYRYHENDIDALHNLANAIMELRPSCLAENDIDSLNEWIEQVIQLENMINPSRHLISYWSDDPSWEPTDNHDIMIMQDGTEIKWESHLARWESME